MQIYEGVEQVRPLNYGHEGNDRLKQLFDLTSLAHALLNYEKLENNNNKIDKLVVGLWNTGIGQLFNVTF